MDKLVDALRSQIGKKLLTGVTGIGLMVFVLGHLLGNLQMFIGSEMFNSYGHKLESLGPLLYLIELGLIAFFLSHAALGVSIALKKKKAKPVTYAVQKSAGGASKQSASSRSMMVTGSILLLFTIGHVISFKYGPGIKEGYVQVINGVEVRDLHRLVVETFANPLYAFGYIAVMLLLGTHLRHGFWSAFQSLGAINKKYSSAIYTLGAVFAAFTALGFLVLPLWIFFTGGAK
jgi:succinate dehydrogenase / fumarate reductase cytochrome b subunit